MRILVVGGGGYLGSVLTTQLLEDGHTVRVYDQFLFGKEPLAPWRTHRALEVWLGDIRDLTSFMRALVGVEAVALLAALVGEKACDRNPRETIGVNYVAPVALAEMCAQVGIHRFLYASTDSAYGIQEGIMTEDSPLNPISLYARLKAEVERRLLMMAGDRFAPCILRMATIYGLSPRMRFDLIVNLLAMQAAVHGRVTIHGGKQWRPFVHVEDAARAFRLALQAPLDAIRGQVFNVGSDEQNCQLWQVGDMVRQVIPDVGVEMTDVPPDLRDYHVSFQKIRGTLGFTVQHSVPGGIREVYQAVRSGQIADPLSARYRNA